MTDKEITAPKEFTIDRYKWMTDYTNERLGDDSELLHATGRMCCLGFYALACGLNKDDILEVADPESLLGHRLPHMLKEDGFADNAYNSSLAQKLISANDSGGDDHDAREAAVKEQFGTVGVEVKFTGEYQTEDELAEEKAAEEADQADYDGR